MSPKHEPDIDPATVERLYSAALTGLCANSRGTSAAADIAEAARIVAEEALRELEELQGDPERAWREELSGR